MHWKILFSFLLSDVSSNGIDFLSIESIGIGIDFGPVRGIGIGLAKLALSVSFKDPFHALRFEK